MWKYECANLRIIFSHFIKVKNDLDLHYVPLQLSVHKTVWKQLLLNCKYMHDVTHLSKHQNCFSLVFILWKTDVKKERLSPLVSAKVVKWEVSSNFLQWLGTKVPVCLVWLTVSNYKYSSYILTDFGIWFIVLIGLFCTLFFSEIPASSILCSQTKRSVAKCF